DIIIKKTGATGDSVQQFSDIYDYLVNNIAVTDPYEKAGSAVGELNTQFGLTGDALQSASTSVMEFAEINDSDVTSSVQSAEQAMASFNMTSDQLPGVLDAVTYAAQTTGASADTIFQSCISGSETLQSLGLSFSESAILMGQFSQAGIDSSTAVSVLGKAQVKFAGEGKTMQQGLSDLQSVINSNASEEDKLAAVTDVLGSKGALNFLKLAESGKLNFADLASSADASVGSVSSTFDSVTGSDEQLELALQNLQSAFATLGGAIAEALLPIIQTLAPLIKNLADWFTSLPDGVQQAIIIFTALMTVFGLLLPVILAIVVGFGSFGAILLPIIGIAAGIAAAITAVILIIQNWGSICEWFGNLWNAIWSGVTSFFGGVGQSIQDTWNGAMSWISQKADDAKSGISSTFQGIKDGCINAFNSVKDGITNAISTAYNNVKDWFQKIKDTLSGTLSFPNIKMPHFSITGSFSLNPPKVPSFGVQWYAKGGVLTKPTLFGMNGDQAMGGGDAGPEAVAPISVLQQYVSQAVEGSNAQIAALLSSIFDYMQSGQMIPVTELDGEVITKVVESNISDKQTSARRAKGY
ncbi:MAG: phage tail tape measure protein, partial [Proteobacteria bacterium]|nr:phage tail tape measure protein [Pseudomonadota bacterium]